MGAFVTVAPTAPSRSRPRILQTCAWRGQHSIHSCTSVFRGKRLFRSWTLPNAQVSQVPRAMFSGGGIFGVGASEVIVIIAVGWLLLGPQKLFALAKDSGRVLGQLSRTAAEAKETFSEAVDLDLLTAEAEELKASFQAPVRKKVRKEKDNAEVEDDDEALKEADNAVNEALKEAGKVHDEALKEADKLDDVVLGPLQDTLAVNGEASTDINRRGFLDQLKRASDPDQVAPSNVPDISVEADEQEEFKRLEQEYLAAKIRMDKRQSEAIGKEAPDSTKNTEDR